MAQIGNHRNAPIEESMVRHMVWNQLRSFKSKFSREYGEMVICCDNTNFWRKKFFPYYKAGRKKMRDESEFNWNHIFEIIANLRQELKEFGPYRVIDVESAEADDVIATLVNKHGNILNTGERMLVVSADKDFIQLQKFGNVKQYDPIRGRWISHVSPETYLKEHIIRGDTGDGVPNILSNDDCFVVGDRQKKLTKKRLEYLINTSPDEYDEPEVKRNYQRNETLIDLSKIPENIKNQVHQQYDSQSNRDRSKLYNYFVSFKLKNLMENLSDF